MIINKTKLDNAISIAAATNSVTVYSKKASRVLRYSEQVINGYQKGVFAADVLEDAIEEIYPELWCEVCKHISSTRREHAQCQACGGWYVAESIPSENKTNQTAPALGEIDRDILASVEIELETRTGQLISIYSARSAAAIRYLRLVNDITSMSAAGADLLEIGLAELYPEFF